MATTPITARRAVVGSAIPAMSWGMEPDCGEKVIVCYDFYGESGDQVPMFAC